MSPSPQRVCPFIPVSSREGLLTVLQTQEEHGVVLQGSLPAAGRIKKCISASSAASMVGNMGGRPHLERPFVRISTKTELQTFPALNMKCKSFWVFLNSYSYPQKPQSIKQEEQQPRLPR